MQLTLAHKAETPQIVDLFRVTFGQSEGPDEGALIGRLAEDMMADVDTDDLFVATARNGGRLLGAAIFSRLTYPNDSRAVFLLAPVAVTPHEQGKGIGQKLIRYGLDHLQERAVDIAITYGDSNFYSRVGFKPITEEDAPPPLRLTFPHGWLGQSLSGPSFRPLIGPSHCVGPINGTAYW